jgi:hypothetical protein
MQPLHSGLDDVGVTLVHGEPSLPLEVPPAPPAPPEPEDVCSQTPVEVLRVKSV